MLFWVWGMTSNHLIVWQRLFFYETLSYVYFTKISLVWTIHTVHESKQLYFLCLTEVVLNPTGRDLKWLKLDQIYWKGFYVIWCALIWYCCELVVNTKVIKLIEVRVLCSLHTLHFSVKCEMYRLFRLFLLRYSFL